MSLYDDFYGDRFRWYVGVVKDVSSDRARCRVRIFGIHTTEDTSKLSDNDLPWALVMYPVTGSQMSSGNVSHDLKPGTWVVGFFMDGTDCQQPVIMGVINGGENSMSSSTTPSSATPGTTPTTGADTTPSTTTGAGTTIPGTGRVPATNSQSALPGSNNAERLYNFFYEKLLSIQSRVSGDIHIIASTMVGNFIQESGLDPNRPNVSEGGVGLAQWRWLNGGGRWAAMNRYFNQPPKTVPTFDQQANFIWHELMSGVQSPKALRYLLSAKTIEDAAIGMCYYEYNGSIKGGNFVGPQAAEYQGIVRNARPVAATFKYSGRSTSSTPSNGGTS